MMFALDASIVHIATSIMCMLSVVLSDLVSRCILQRSAIIVGKAGPSGASTRVDLGWVVISGLLTVLGGRGPHLYICFLHTPLLSDAQI